MRQAYDYWQDQPGCRTSLTQLAPRSRRRLGVGVRMCSVKRTMKRGFLQRPFRIVAHTHLHPAPGPQWGAGWYSLPSEEGRQQAETVPNGYGYALQGAVAAEPKHKCFSRRCQTVLDQSVRREGTVDVTSTGKLNNSCGDKCCFRSALPPHVNCRKKELQISRQYSIHPAPADRLVRQSPSKNVVCPPVGGRPIFYGFF